MIKRNAGIIGGFGIVLVILSILVVTALTSIAEVAQGQGKAPPPRTVLLTGPLAKGYDGSDPLINAASGEGIILAATIAGCVDQLSDGVCQHLRGLDLHETLQAANTTIDDQISTVDDHITNHPGASSASDGVVSGGSVSGTTLTLTRTESLSDISITGLPNSGGASLDAATDTPEPVGTAGVGTSVDYSRGDHVHAADYGDISDTPTIPTLPETAVYYGHPGIFGSVQTGMYAPTNEVTISGATTNHRLIFAGVPNHEFPDASADVGLEFEGDDADLSDLDLGHSEAITAVSSTSVFRFTDPGSYYINLGYLTASTWTSPGVVPLTFHRVESGTDPILWVHNLPRTSGVMSDLVEYNFLNVTTSNADDLYYFKLSDVGDDALGEKDIAYSLIVGNAR